VIDNCPSDDSTKTVVEAFARVRYVREPRKGLDVARNRAVREARHAVVAFIDDDAVPDRGWLRALLANFDDPMVQAVTGLTIPVELETDAQETHERLSSFSRGFERRVFDARRFNPAAAGQIGAGVNMAARRSVFDQVGLFDEALDAGTRSRSGGDTEMLARILLYGYRIVYEPSALCWHRHRRTWRELRQMTYGNGVGVYAWWTSFAMSQKFLWMIEPAASWFFGSQIPALLGGVRRWHRGAPLDLAVAELAGCAAGPWKYAAARRALKREIAG
jgi:GT2 family glycosyltransferase